MPRLYDRVGSRPCTLTARFEDFATDWAGATAALCASLEDRSHLTVI